ncbi:MAG: hypothetical protein RQ856_05045 [Candidatus Izemoplasmatales bacterium]|nr:hypothetical protein [Candidatus Izemoplasmatales bacterium]
MTYIPKKTINFIDATEASHAGSTSEVIMKSFFIPAGTIKVGDVLRTYFMCKKETILAQMTNRVYLNTSNSLTAAIPLDNYNTNARTHYHEQILIVRPNELLPTFNRTLTNVSSYPHGGNAEILSSLLATGINYNVDNYVLFTSKLDDATELVTNYLAQVKIIKQ